MVYSRQCYLLLHVLCHVCVLANQICGNSTDDPQRLKRGNDMGVCVETSDVEHQWMLTSSAGPLDNIGFNIVPL